MRTLRAIVCGIVISSTAAARPIPPTKPPPAKDGCQPPAQVDPFDPRPICKDVGPSLEIKVGTGVSRTDVSGESTTFAPGSTVFVWTRIPSGPSTVKHVWKRNGTVVSSVPLKLGKARTAHSRRKIAAASVWEVEVTANGASLGKVTFSVQ